MTINDDSVFKIFGLEFVHLYAALLLLLIVGRYYFSSVGIM